jgi:hypothetical protein
MNATGIMRVALIVISVLLIGTIWMIVAMLASANEPSIADDGRLAAEQESTSVSTALPERHRATALPAPALWCSR